MQQQDDGKNVIQTKCAGGEMTMSAEMIIIGVLVILFMIFGLRSFIQFLEQLVSGLLKLAIAGTIIALIISLGRIVVP